MFIPYGITKWALMGIDSLLDPASSGLKRKCSCWLHNWSPRSWLDRPPWSHRRGPTMLHCCVSSVAPSVEWEANVHLNQATDDCSLITLWFETCAKDKDKFFILFQYYEEIMNIWRQTAVEAEAVTLSGGLCFEWHLLAFQGELEHTLGAISSGNKFNSFSSHRGLLEFKRSR